MLPTATYVSFPYAILLTINDVPISVLVFIVLAVKSSVLLDIANLLFNSFGIMFFVTNPLSFSSSLVLVGIGIFY